MKTKKASIMFSAISWSDYLTILLVSAIFYYAFVVYSFYKNEVLLFFKRRQVATHDIAGLNVFNQDTEVVGNKEQERNSTLMPIAQSHPGYSLLVQNLIDELQAFIEEAGENKFNKEQILSSITYLINKSPSVKLSPFKQSISNIIIEECTAHCSVAITENEVNDLWKAE